MFCTDANLFAWMALFRPTNQPTPNHPVSNFNHFGTFDPPRNRTQSNQQKSLLQISFKWATNCKLKDNTQRPRAPKKTLYLQTNQKWVLLKWGQAKKNSLVKGAIIAEIGRVSFCFAASFGYNFCSLSLFLTLFLFLRHVYQSVSFSQYS